MLSSVYWINIFIPIIWSNVVALSIMKTATWPLIFYNANIVVILSNPENEWGEESFSTDAWADSALSSMRLSCGLASFHCSSWTRGGVGILRSCSSLGPLPGRDVLFGFSLRAVWLLTPLMDIVGMTDDPLSNRTHAMLKQYLSDVRAMVLRRS